MANISIHGSHNAAVVVEEGGNILCVIEAERFLSFKNAGLAQYKSPRHIMISVEAILAWIKKEYGISEYENCYFSSTDFVGEDWNREYKFYQTIDLVKAKNYIHGLHHESHAYGAFYQTDCSEALVVSYDGGGDDGKFNFYTIKRGEPLQLVKRVKNPVYQDRDYSLAFPYMIFGQYLAEIKQEDLGNGNLVWGGKLMGLASYGVAREDWLPFFVDFYESDPDGKNEDYKAKLEKLGDNIGIKFSAEERLTGQNAWDVAMTSQKAFELILESEILTVMTDIALKGMSVPKDICITGGCGLNILANTALVEKFPMHNIHVSPNPSDCGIALGNMLRHLKPEKAYDATYAGIPLLDEPLLATYIQHWSYVKNIASNKESYHPIECGDIETVVDDLVAGLIIGVVRGGSEHGPRALGNRSILCNPSIPGMKDILNEKVKHREPYRPFAPVVRLEDVNRYFLWHKESRWMSFCPLVRKEWRSKLGAVTHVDNTARVQTVTRDQNQFIYDLLTRLHEKTGVGVLLNTSFNVDGKPILSTCKDAFEVFEKTQMDGLLINDIYIKK